MSLFSYTLTPPSRTSSEHAAFHTEGQHWLSTSSALLGNASETVWLLLHGGPGSGANERMLRPFESAHLSAIAPHQPGCDPRPWPRSRPMRLSILIEDLEALRCQLQIEHWPVFGGSWGAYLAVAYSLKHSERVSSLMLRAPFVGGSADLWRFLANFAREKSFSSTLFRLENRNLLSSWLHKAEQLFRFGASYHATPATRDLTNQWLQTETHLAAHCARRAWLDMQTDQPLAEQHALWGRLMRQSRRESAFAKMKRQPARTKLAKIRIQATLLSQARKNPVQRLRQQALMAGNTTFPSMTLLHGRHDRICAPRNAELLCQLFNSSKLQLLRSGHLGVEPCMEKVMTQQLKTGLSA